MGTTRVEIDGLVDLQRLLVLGGEAAAKAAGEAIYAEALIAFADSQVEVPVDTGVLRASGQVKPPTTSGDDVEVEIAYGGAASEYAYIVHERLDVEHASPTKAKYLEAPVVRRQATLGPAINLRIKAALRRLTR